MDKVEKMDQQKKKKKWRVSTQRQEKKKKENKIKNDDILEATRVTVSEMLMGQVR